MTILIDTYDAILQGHEATEENAIDYARGMVWSECELHKQQPMVSHSRYVDTIDGIEIYYSFGADYYFFCQEPEFT